MRSYGQAVVVVAVGVAFMSGCASHGTWDGTLSQFGQMRAVLGDKQHEGRVLLSDLTKKPHCYAVGAAAELHGEVTICDGDVTVTSVDAQAQPVTDDDEAADLQATLLVAAYVPRWVERPVYSDVAPDEFERFLHESAVAARLDPSRPFPFLIDGDLADLEIHVINGGCPMRAKRMGETLPPELAPYRGTFAHASGRLVGFYAADAVGKLTHFGTKTHTHVLLDGKDDATLTGHVERVGLKAGATLRLPAP